MEFKPTKLALCAAGILNYKIEDSRLAVCGICQTKEAPIAETIPLEYPDKTIQSTSICWNCFAPSLEFNNLGKARNFPCPCGSKKKLKHCCLQLLQRSNTITDLNPKFVSPNESNQDGL